MRNTFRLSMTVLVLCLVFAAPMRVAWAAQDEAERYWGQGEQQYNAGRYREAIPYYVRSLSICGSNLECTVSNLNGIGASYEALNDDRKAFPYYQRALDAARKSGNKDLIATNLFNVGAIESRTFNHYEKALTLLEESLVLFQDLGDKSSLAVVLFHAGKNAQVLGNYDKALSYFDRSLRLNREMKNDAGVAGNLNLIGNVYLGMGQLDKPMSFYEEALRINRRLNDQKETAITLRNMGDVYADMVQYDHALSSYQEALEIEKRAGLKAETAVTLNNIGTVQKELNQYDNALGFYEQSLKLSRELDRTPDIAATLNNMGDAQAALGRSDEALADYQQSLALERGLDRSAKLAIVLNNIGMEQFRAGRFDEALRYLNEALGIDRKLDNPHSIAVRLNNIGAVYLRQKRYQEAEYIFLERRGLQARIAKTKLIHAGLTQTYLALRRYDDALALLQETPPVWRDSPQRRMEYATQYGQALLGKGRLKEATHQLLQAVLLSEEMRSQSAEKERFFSGGGYIGRLAPHRLLVSVLAEEALRGDAMDSEFKPYGRDLASAAFYFSELTKARALLEAMAKAAKRYDDPQVSADLRGREASLLRQLDEAEGSREAAFKKGEAALAELEKKKKKLGQELDEVVAEMRKIYPRYAALRYPKSLPPEDLPLRPKEMLLEFSLASDAGYVFIVAPGGAVRISRINSTREALEQKVRSFMEPLTEGKPDAFSRSRAQELYAVLLAGPLSAVPAADSVVIVPDGLLGLLPFEALVAKQGENDRDTVYVGDNRSMTYVQSATALALTRTVKQSGAVKPLFALGNPVFDSADPRYQAYLQGRSVRVASGDVSRYGFRGVTVLPKGEKEWREVYFPPLPETEDEVRAIARIFGVKPQPPDVLLGLSASESGLQKIPLRQYRYLHFATHADLPGTVRGIREPFLILGQVENRGSDDGFLTLSEVLGLGLDADLVVLSACSTGRGKMMEGEGVANFARAFLYAGARSVVVSLWEVASEPAVQFMETFYGGLKAGKSKAEALRTARRVIKKKYPNPFYWAVFILHGEG
jgi:CHAT domain-containing protein/tetratricopeptide (TPR) repeat protein